MFTDDFTMTHYLLGRFMVEPITPKSFITALLVFLLFSVHVKKSIYCSLKPLLFLYLVRRFGRRGIPAFFGNYGGFGPVGFVVRRHDLHAVFIEDILNGLMKFGIKSCHLFGFVGVNIQFIGHVKIIQ